LCENTAVDWDSPEKEVICWNCNEDTYWDNTAKRCLPTCPETRPYAMVRGGRGSVYGLLSNNVDLDFYHELECVSECPDNNIK